MSKTQFLFIAILFFNLSFPILAQKEINIYEPTSEVTVFFTGAQLRHKYATNVNAGKQTLVFQKLTDFLDPNTIQVKAPSSVTILSVRMRKNYEDQTLSSQEIEILNAKIKDIDKKYDLLINEYAVLELDRKLIMQNRELGSETQGVKIAELKEAYIFMHQKLNEVILRESDIKSELETLSKKRNTLEQELSSQRSKPVINYSEVLVEIDASHSSNCDLALSYMTPKATWKPIYNMRSEGIGKNIKLEAQANVSQTTGLDWKNAKIALSTNDPYLNATEPKIEPWYIYYNNYEQPKYIQERHLPEVDYSGQKLRGEVIDASTGESLPFTKMTFYGFPNSGTVTDALGKFEIIVPKDAKTLAAEYIGYSSQTLDITGPYLKFFLVADEVDLDEVVVTSQGGIATGATSYAWTTNADALSSYVYEDYEGENKAMDALEIRGGRKDKAFKKSRGFYNVTVTDANGSTVNTVLEQKELMVEYQIISKMDIPCDGIDHKVSIAAFDLPAYYEFHSTPKIDPHVFLSAQITGWEKLNLLSGPSSIYFDGTYIGETFLDLNTTKDTLNLSFGTDSKMVIERTKITEKTKSRTVGSREKYDIGWEIVVKNNGAAMIPIVIKDQFPISKNDDIKVKRGELTHNGTINDKNGLITWTIKQGVSKSEKLNFEYSVDYEKGFSLILE